MKRKFNTNGITALEFLVIVVVCLILSLVLVFIVISDTEKEKYEVFRYNAKIVGLNAINLNANSSNTTTYLFELVDNNLVTKIKNNFSGDKFCDLYESKVIFDNSGKKVTLKCGNYIIYNQDVTDKDYNIYKVSEWSFDKIEGDYVDKEEVYAILNDGENLLGDYFEKDLFIKLVSKNYGSKYNSLESIKNDFNVDVKTIYRKRTLID